jgi:hypothetical protein
MDDRSKSPVPSLFFLSLYPPLSPICRLSSHLTRLYHVPLQVAGVDDRYQERFRMVVEYLMFREASQVGATSAKDTHSA